MDIKRLTSANITMLRRRARLTQLELARLVGVTEATIANWESARTGTEWFERLARLCAALGCKPDELCGAALLADGRSTAEVRRMGDAGLAKNPGRVEEHPA